MLSVFLSTGGVRGEEQKNQRRCGPSAEELFLSFEHLHVFFNRNHSFSFFWRAGVLRRVQDLGSHEGATRREHYEVRVHSRTTTGPPTTPTVTASNQDARKKKKRHQPHFHLLYNMMAAPSLSVVV